MNQDSIFDNKNVNSPKSLLPFFAYQILRNQTNKVKHLTLEELGECLQDYPYEINVDRRAIGRTINTLEGTMPGYHLCSTGAYYDKAEGISMTNPFGLERESDSKNVNRRESLLPIFVYRILCDQTDMETRMTLQELIDELSVSYKIKVAKRTLVRTINTLDLYMAGCHLCLTGVYHENAYDFWLMNRPGLWRKVA